MSSFTPTGRQLVLLTKISWNIALSLAALQTGDVETDIAASIDLIELARGGLIRYQMGDEVVSCTRAGRVWVKGHENWRGGDVRQAGSGH